MRYLVLLRGINVGGHNKVPMAGLRAYASDLGLRGSGAARSQRRLRVGATASLMVGFPGAEATSKPGRWRKTRSPWDLGDGPAPRRPPTRP